MATISARIDEDVKAEAENIADEIGITLSSAICIFIKKFVSCNGFPFEVSAPDNKIRIIDENTLDDAVKKAVSDSSNNGQAKTFSYVDPVTNKMITVTKD